MRLSPAQHSTLHTLHQFGPAQAVEVLQSPGMNGVRRSKLEWHAATKITLAHLERSGLVAVVRTELPTPKNAVGRSGNKRRKLTISITDKGIAALAA